MHMSAGTGPVNPASGCFLLAGPTAVGKSEVALLLAEKLGGEIVSVDSMQVYRGLDIGTAKPSLQERQRVPHHFIDVAEVTESFDAARFVRLAGEAVNDIQRRGKVPLLCGGTGLYFKAFLEGLGDAPPSDPGLRAELEKISTDERLRELAERDPQTYAVIDRQNPRRVIRALEVIRLTGKPFSVQRAQWSQSSKEYLCFGLSRSPGDLRRRIDLRVEQMFSRGLVVETEQLLERGLQQNPTAAQALGYRQVLEHLQGLRPLAETIELVKIRTRQFAKRQMTWFRRQLRVNWVHLDETQSADAVADDLARRFRAAAEAQGLAVFKQKTTTDEH
jgi:tRNA dimethylallyltransferase